MTDPCGPKSENVSVVVRVRPMSESEKTQSFKNVVTADGVSNSIKINNPNAGNSYNDLERSFTFDHVFASETSQVGAAVFQSS